MRRNWEQSSTIDSGSSLRHAGFKQVEVVGGGGGGKKKKKFTEIKIFSNRILPKKKANSIQNRRKNPNAVIELFYKE